MLIGISLSICTVFLLYMIFFVMVHMTYFSNWKGSCVLINTCIWKIRRKFACWHDEIFVLKVIYTLREGLIVFFCIVRFCMIFFGLIQITTFCSYGFASLLGDYFCLDFCRLLFFCRILLRVYGQNIDLWRLVNFGLVPWVPFLFWVHWVVIFLGIIIFWRVCRTWLLGNDACVDWCGDH